MNEPVFLIGFMGSGKTRTGLLLAQELGWDWLDLDDEIVQQAGKSIPEIFAADGEEVFREWERKVFTEAMQREALVVSCGGGIVTCEENLKDLLSLQRVVCLRVTPETVFRRVGNDPRRPLLQGANPLERIRELMKEREPFYSRFPLQLDVDRLRTTEVTEQIRKLLQLS